MAKKKPRTPTPPRQTPPRQSGPRPVQAPKARTGGGDLGLAHRNLLYGVAGAGIVALIAVVILIAVAGKSTNKSASAAHDAAVTKHITSLMLAAGCTYRTVNGYLPKGQTMHLTSLTKKFPWNTDPPSNGQHYPYWDVWNFYTDVQNPRMVVHNEEHGGIILWWGLKVPQATIDKLRAFYDEQTTGTFGTPDATLGTKIAITAWTGDTSLYQRNGYYGFGHIGICPAYSAATRTAFEAFRSAYRGKGPEGIPLSLDKQGLGPNNS